MIYAVENGSFSYRKSALSKEMVLRDIRLRLPGGTLTAVLGPNGAGKTTLLRCLLGFLPWRTGRSTLDGQDIRQIDPRALWRRVAYVPQARAATGGARVEDMVLLGRGSRFGMFSQPSGEDREAARRAIRELGIEGIADRLCSELSGGEMQMALIARAVAAEPELMVLDEPESNLDFRNQLLILSTLRGLADKGIACLFNTHYPAHALRYADNALLLDREGTPAFGPAAAVVTEENLNAAFGVEAAIREIETRHIAFPDVVPVRVAEPGRGGAEQGRGIVVQDTGDTRIAILGIIVENRDSAEKINALLHEYAAHVIGRMGMPYEKKHLSIISVTLDAPEAVISSIAGKLGMLPGVSVKATYSRR